MQTQENKHPDGLDQIIEGRSFLEKMFEKGLWGTRYIVVIAVIFSTLAAISLFIIGSYEVTLGVKQYIGQLKEYHQISDGSEVSAQTNLPLNFGWGDSLNDNNDMSDIHSNAHLLDEEDNHHHHPFPKHTGLLGIIIGAVDLYLIGVVLLIFGFGIYELFISKMDIARRKKDVSILEVNNIDQLKNKIIKVIIMVLIVSFFEKILSVSDSYKEPIQMMWFAISIFSLDFGVYLINKHHQKQA